MKRLGQFIQIALLASMVLFLIVIFVELHGQIFQFIAKLSLEIAKRITQP